ncbi:MAG: TMEM165/GDT1 family protein [Candidatus Omnitrophica bacterium]|nr:TMEM165/GDT1 family protein [Candidatus Omnitrophota bacterium]
MIMQGLWVPFVSVLAAEFGDKTMIAILLLASKTRHPAFLLTGAMLGFFLVDGAGLIFGAWSGSAIPAEWLKWASGALFTGLGLKMLLEKTEAGEEDVRHHDKHPLAGGFLVIFLAEWGDKTQIAAALFASRFELWQAALGTFSALLAVTAAAIFLGQWLGHRLKPGLLQKSAAVLFILMGLMTLLF